MNAVLKNLLRRITFWEAERKKAAFDRAARRFRETQERTLLAKLRRNAGSQFGREHGFAGIRGIEDFRKRVALLTYEQMSPYIEKVRRGETQALFRPGEKIRMFALSSGTTDAPKTIPVTDPFLAEYKRGSLLWGVRAALDHDFLDGKILPIVSPACEEKTPLGVPCGAISGMIAQTQKYIARSLYPVPGPVYDVADAETRDYLMLRFSLGEKVTFVTTANPSTLLRLARAAEKHAENLLRDLRDGSLTPPGDGAGGTNGFRWKFSPRPDLAKKAQAAVRGGRPFHPRVFWPELKLLACWKGGTLSSYLPAVRELYGEAPIRDLGLLASEGRMTIPLGDEGCGGVLDLQSHFFEFLPEEETFRPNARTLLGHELEAGKKYFILMTTSAGLYRYHIHDLVEVEGFFHQAPVLRFLNKGRYFSSLTGEKLSEYQAVQAVQRCASEQGVPLERFILAPQWGEPPGYVLVAEEDFCVGDARWKELERGVERHLQNLNPEYRSKRESRRLAPVELQLAAPGTFRKWDAAQQAARRGRQEQFKPRFLTNDLSFLEEFGIKETIKNA